MNLTGCTGAIRVFSTRSLLVAAMLLLPTLSAFAQDKSSEAARQIDFANSLYLRKIYDMAASEYEQYIEAFPGEATEEYARFQQAECLYNLHQYPQASTAYQQLLQRFPQGDKRPMALLRIGEISYRNKRYQEAVEILRLLLAEAPADDVSEVALYHLGSTYLALKQYEKAQQTLKSQLERYPEGLFCPFAKLNLGTVYKRVDNYDEALRMWREVVDHVGDSPQARIRNLAIEAMYRLAETLNDLTRHEAAAATFAALADRYPDSAQLPSALYHEAWSWLSAGQYAKARQRAESLRTRPGLGDLDAFRVGTQYLIGLSHFESQAYEKALESFQAVLALPPSLPQWNEYAPKARHQRVWAYFLKSDLKEAQAEADRFFQQFPAHELAGEVQFVKAEALFRQDRYEPAQAEYQKFLTDFPNSRYQPEAMFKLGSCDMSLKRFQQAAASFQAFLDQYPKHALSAEAALMRGEAFFEAKAFAEASEAYQRFLRAYPEADQIEYALYQLGQSFRHQGQFDRLAEASRELLKRFPESHYRATALFWTAYEAERQEKPEDAAAAFEALLGDFPKSQFAPQARLRLAMIYFRQQHEMESAQLFQTLIESEEPPEGVTPPVYFWTAAQLTHQGHHENAISVYRRLADQYPRRDVIEETSFRIAESYGRLSDWSKAASAYDRVLKEFPDGEFAEAAALGHAQVDVQRGNLDAAIRQLQPLTGSIDSALAAQAGLLLGDTLERSGQVDPAVAAYLRVAFLYDHPEIVPEAYWKASQLLLRQGDREQAEKHLGELRKLYPESRYAQMSRPRQSADSPQSATASPAAATAEVKRQSQ